MNFPSFIFLLGILFKKCRSDDYYELKGYDDNKGKCNRRATFGGFSYLPSPGKCNQFYQCDEDGVAHLQSCAAGTFYNGEECSHADDVDCPYDPCRMKPDGYRYSDGQSCYGYFICVHGRSKYQTCPNAFFYNGFKKTCQHDPTCYKDNLIHPCSFGTTFPNPGKPDSFYLYDGHYKMTSMKCPRGLWYRPDLCTCDWIIPGKILGHKCSPMFHFSYNGNFLEKNNRVQQVPNTNVGIFRKAALFNKGGKIIIWSMNNVDFESDFELSFEFMVKTFKGEVALVSNDGGNGYGATYKITYVPSLGIVKGYIIQKDKRMLKMQVFDVNPQKVNKVSFSRQDEKLLLKVNKMPPAVVLSDDGIAKNGNPLVIGKAGGCRDFEGFIDEVKFYPCIRKRKEYDLFEYSSKTDDDYYDS